MVEIVNYAFEGVELSFAVDEWSEFMFSKVYLIN